MPRGREPPVLVGTFSYQMNGSTEVLQAAYDAELRTFPHRACWMGLDRGMPPSGPVAGAVVLTGPGSLRAC